LMCGGAADGESVNKFDADDPGARDRAFGVWAARVYSSAGSARIAENGFRSTRGCTSAAPEPAKSPRPDLAAKTVDGVPGARR